MCQLLLLSEVSLFQLLFLVSQIFGSLILFDNSEKGIDVKIIPSNYESLLRLVDANKSLLSEPLEFLHPFFCSVFGSKM